MEFLEEQSLGYFDFVICIYTYFIVTEMVFRINIF